jgi:hypothetical protein
LSKDLTDTTVWHLDVGLLRPETKGGFKGSAVRRLKVVHELGSERCETVRSLSSNEIVKKNKILVREDQKISTADA